MDSSESSVIGNPRAFQVRRQLVVCRIDDSKQRSQVELAKLSLPGINQSIAGALARPMVHPTSSRVYRLAHIAHRAITWIYQDIDFHAQVEPALATNARKRPVVARMPQLCCPWLHFFASLSNRLQSSAWIALERASEPSGLAYSENRLEYANDYKHVQDLVRLLSTKTLNDSERLREC